MRTLRIGVMLAFVAAATACSGDDDPIAVDTVPVTTGSAVATTEPVTATSGPATSGPATTTAPTSAATTEPAPATTAPATTAPVATPAPTTTAPIPTTAATRTSDVRVYLARGEQLVIVHRQVAGPAVLRGALSELLDGPGAAEASDGLFTTIPAGTSLLDVDLDDRIATVDLSDEFESGGGSMSMLARVAQVVFTATQFDNVDAVQFWMNGRPIEFLGGEGIVLDEPQTRSDTPVELTGGIIFDLPAPGSTVTSPITVTGEGDVFEGDFPLRVRRDGVELGDVVIVRAGAWGDWADFETTVTVDVGPGPIELVAIDEGGCGPPDCPPAVETVLPLVLAD